MMPNEISLPVFRCIPCGHIWVPRIQRPVRCPECRNPRWNEGEPGRSKKAKKNTGRA